MSSPSARSNASQIDKMKTNFKMNYSKDECLKPSSKPSKQFNLPFGQSRQPFKVTEYCKENSTTLNSSKPKNTSSVIKNIRDFKTSLTDLTGSKI